MKTWLYWMLIVMVLVACRLTDANPTAITSTVQPSPILPYASPEKIASSTPIFIEPIATPLSTVAPSSTPTITYTPNPPLLPISHPNIYEPPGELYSTVFSIPVGNGQAVHYRGGDNPDMEITGPNAIAVLPDDSFMIADLIANRLLHYSQSGTLLDMIELSDVGIVNVADLRAWGDKLFLLEISLDFYPVRYKVNQLSLDGKLVASTDIPEGYHSENGLTGIAVDCDGGILIELEGGGQLYRLLDILKETSANMPGGYHCDDKLFRVTNTTSPDHRTILAGEKFYNTQLTTSYGGILILNVFDDGSLYMIREDVIQQSVIKVDQTVIYVGRGGVNQGVARVPLHEMYYPIMRSIAVNTKGEAFLLLPRRNSLDVVRLNFYTHLDPLPPSSINPQITISTNQP